MILIMIGSSQDLLMRRMEEKKTIWIVLWIHGPGWTTHASLRRQAWWWSRPLVMIPLSGRVPGRASGPSRSRVDDGGGLQYVSWKDFSGHRVFMMKGIYRRKGDVRGWPRGPHLALAWPGVGRATLWCGCLLAPLCLSFGLRLCVK
jgi:hypothetical protein